MSVPVTAAGVRAYRALRRQPLHLYFLKLGELVAGGLLARSAGAPHRRRGRGATDRRHAAARARCPRRTGALEEELRADEKERAEHVMLVDLGRNDVGRVAEYGTVETNEYMTVERYSQVMHLVSNVRGRRRPGLGAARRGARLLPGRHA